MSTKRPALIEAILRAPDDDGPRLVCADWFEEQGGEADVARAEFIRSQVLRARLAADDPRQRAMYARELRLLRRYAAAWQGSHFAFRKSRFRRGFIEHVHLHLQTFQHHRRQMYALEPVRDVSLTGFWRARPEQVRRLADCEEWRHVDTLWITCMESRHRHLEVVRTLLESPRLQGLRRLAYGPGVRSRRWCRRSTTSADGSAIFSWDECEGKALIVSERAYAEQLTPTHRATRHTPPSRRAPSRRAGPGP